MRIPALLAAAMIAAPASAQSGVPDAIKTRVNELVARCAQAGGTLGSMTGQGRFVIPADFSGDGRTDFIVSEGNMPCVGKPALFRPDGASRLELWVGEGGNARLAFADRVIAYRVLAGKPARLQIARSGPACGGPARCGDELRWNAAASRFDEVATDGRKIAARPATGAAVAAGAPPVAPAPAAGGKPAPAAAVPPVAADAEVRFKAACRKRYLADRPAKTDWIDSSCAEEWGRVAASQQVAEALLRAGPGGPGAPPPLADLRQRMQGVRWAARPEKGQLASGQLGGFVITVEGAGRPEKASVGWTKVGEMLPLNIPEAFTARGAKLTLTRCEKMGAGEGERSWLVAFPGRPPFDLTVYERTAPTANAWSHYTATVRLDGAPPPRGPTNCEQFW